MTKIISESKNSSPCYLPLKETKPDLTRLDREKILKGLKKGKKS